jgi:hypothetical protein
MILIVRVIRRHAEIEELTITPFISNTARILHANPGGFPSHVSTGPMPSHSFVMPIQGAEAGFANGMGQRPFV